MPVVHQRHLNMPHLAIHKLSFLKSVEKAHAVLDTNALIAERLGVRAEPMRMDLQAKYAALACGDGGWRCLPAISCCGRWTRWRG
jgi:3'(2'), 5'-bisphosphate nucleotidase